MALKILIRSRIKSRNFKAKKADFGSKRIQILRPKIEIWGGEKILIWRPQNRRFSAQKSPKFQLKNLHFLGAILRRKMQIWGVSKSPKIPFFHHPTVLGLKKAILGKFGGFGVKKSDFGGGFRVGVGVWGRKLQNSG